MAPSNDVKVKAAWSSETSISHHMASRPRRLRYECILKRKSEVV